MSNTEQNQKPEDFGEHIKGAKKETYFKAIDPTHEETKSLPLSKLWKDKDIKAIEDRTLRAIAFAIKDNLPNKPRNAIKLNRWLQNLQHQQDFVVRLIEANDPKYTQKALQDLQGTKVGNQAQLLAKLDYGDYKKIQSVEFWQRYQSDNITLAVKVGGKSHEFSPKQAVTLNDYNPQAVIDEFVDDIKTIIKEQAQETGKKGMSANSFEIYQRRRDETAFISAKTDRQKTALINFKDVSEAREYLKDPENIDKLSQLWTEHREFNSIAKADMRNAVNEERTGQSYRDHDITPDEFMATFGIRGGQFGNWVTGDERQQMLNATYDGFMDLSKALNIEPKAIGLNGRLGIAFGARGSGSASAHYEPNEKVINLTKTRGAGSLAHEWWHALDDYMSSTTKLATQDFKTWASAEGNKLRENLRTEPMNESLKSLIETINKSDFQQRSNNADGLRGKPYFGTMVEMTARAFEGYIQHELSKDGIKNHFLVNIRSEQNWKKNLEAYPYPKTDELEQFNKAYTAVFDTLKDLDKEFVPAQYEPETIIHADTLAIEETTPAETVVSELETQKQENAPSEPQQTPPTQEQDNQVRQLPSAENKAFINGFLENNGFEKGINVGNYRKQVDNNSLLVINVANDVSIQRIENGEMKGREVLLSSLAQELDTKEIEQAFTSSRLWQNQLAQSTPPTAQVEQQPTQTAKAPQETTPAPNISQYKTKLNTPYAEKEQAKALGAKWDNANKTWYAPAGLDLNQFKKWLPQERQAENSTGKTPSNDTSNRIYLYTQPSDNPAIQELKAQGIVKFDLQHKLWFAHKDNQDAVRQWTTRPYVPTPEQALTEHLRSMGIAVATGHPIFDERPHRLANEGSTDKNVMYHAYPNPNGVPYARITNFSRNGVSEWTYPTEHLLALRAIEAVERANGGHAPIQSSYTPKTATAPQTAPRTQQAPQKDPEKIALENKMAERAKMLMSFAPVADTKQNYLAKKQVTANSVARIVPDSSSIPEHLQAHIAIGNTPKQYFYLLANNPNNKLVLQRGNLVIPQTNTQGEIRAFETIAYNSKKYALKDAEKKSMMTALGSLEDGKPIIMAEGYATGATLHENTGQSVVVAFGKNGLMDIAKELRSQYPNSKIYIGADNDHSKEVNAGLIDAVAVQQAVQNVYILVPQFEKGDTGKDWNDVLVDKGIDELKRQIKEQLAVINPQNIDKAQNQAQLRQPVQETIQKHPLDPDVIRQNYPTMSEENINTIQMWRKEIPLRYANEPIRAELALSRLENKLPQYAQGEVLTAPKSQTVEQKPPENTVSQPTPQAQQIDNQQGGWKL